MKRQKETAREPRKRTAIQQEIIDLIRFYEKRGADWTVPAEFTLVRHSGNLQRIIHPTCADTWGRRWTKKKGGEKWMSG